MCVGGLCYHVINRGNRRATVFHDASDYDQFVNLMALAHEAHPVRVVAYCLMPNHFHLVLWPREDGDLSLFVHRLTTTHVRRYHRRYETSGRVWQDRFKSFPIQHDEHLLRVLLYVERNAVRAGLAPRAAAWPWSSIHWCRRGSYPTFGDPGPVARPEDWEARVDGDQPATDVERLRRHLGRGRPYGEPEWTVRTAHDLGLEGSLRERGRPRRRREPEEGDSRPPEKDATEKGASPLF